MKTNQVLTRKMGDFDVLQRTKDGMFNATALLKQWNAANQNEERRLDKFWESTHLDKLMSEIAINEYNFKSPNFGELKKLLSTTSRGKYNSGTWMHPVLFVKFAMYLSPRFEYNVLKFVGDELIKYRKDAGIEYREMCRVVAKLVEKPFVTDAIQNVARAINHIVYNKHHSGIRNNVGCENKMKELTEIEKNVIMLVDCGFITTYEQLINFLRQQWIKRHQPKELAV